MCHFNSQSFGCSISGADDVSPTAVSNQVEHLEPLIEVTTYVNLIPDGVSLDNYGATKPGWYWGFKCDTSSATLI